MLFRLRMAGLPVLARVRHQVPAPACGGPSGVASGGQTHLRWVSRYAGRRCSRFGRSSCLSRPTRPAAPASPGAWIDQPWARPAPARLRKSSAGQPPCPASCTRSAGARSDLPPRRYPKRRCARHKKTRLAAGLSRSRCTGSGGSFGVVSKPSCSVGDRLGGSCCRLGAEQPVHAETNCRDPVAVLLSRADRVDQFIGR